MALPAVGSASYPTPSEIRDAILRDFLFYGLRNGIAFNVLPGSKIFVTATVYANRLSIALSNNQISNDQRNPLTAIDEALEDFARVYGITRRPASRATGFVIIQCTGTVNIPLGFRWTGPNGKKYEPIASMLRTNGQPLEMVAVVAGSEGNLGGGVTGTWDSSAISNLKQQAATDANGIRGGAPEDDNETLRRRLLDRLAAQAIGGNAASVKGWAEGATAAIQAAYVYDAAQGPGSYDLAVVGAEGDRTLSPAIVAQGTAAVLAQMPGGVVKINGTTVFPEEVDVVLKAVLPLPATAGGAGGGWFDAIPYPAEDTQITAFSSTTITVDSTQEPEVGNRIGIWDYAALDASANSAPVMRSFSITNVAGSVNAWALTLDGSLSFVETGMYVSAGAVKLDEYAQVFLAQMRALGPGEKSDNPNIVPRAARFPRPDVTDPYAITSRQLAAVTNEHSEVSDLQYSLVVDTGTATPLTSPSIPPTTADPPRILVLKHFAIRKA